MWAALRTDLREFVSTVAEESSTALNAIDAKLQNTDEDNGGNTPKSSVVVDEDGNVIYDNDSASLTELIRGADPSSSDDVAFSQEDLSELLKDDEILEAFEDLVPGEMSAEEFYKRVVVLDGEDGGVDVLNSVKNFMEGVGKVVAPLQGGARPPFVMNTVVDEEDDEEDLGWDEEEEEESGDDEEDWEQRLAQIEEERDLLHQTVELQRKELEGKVKETLELNETIAVKDKQLETLKSSLEGDEKVTAEKLTEQEATIAKLQRESLNNTNELKQMQDQNENDALAIQSLKEELEHLKNTLKEKDTQLDEARGQMAPMEEEIKLLKKRLDGAGELRSTPDDVSSAASPASSMVKIAHEEGGSPTKQLQEEDKDDEDEDDWGEEWGEEDDL
mmetsp:Transcript_19827/g.24444  ORF Transcript_19827/g.24444 Transcript_19827/m.24444 type:complete len:389 (-) Transcript_19827:278-1444(-)|eukprot:CAMPEP_0172494844 /NCGR_PEP_ID=MMETSP1066-20121228/57477_1 /TAXON_ID=671091 /ORGANISM="Coscinodiscus wailesii, Strain CCMP2513" /LENGTH=388 /DNA_ID=CAMNT_0013266137 /DNA_START=207 /DNA_END=1373 /DNA_ORIENTATION=-